MAIETILYDALIDSSSIKYNVQSRIYSDIRDQDSPTPSIHIDRIDTEYTHTFDSNLPATERATFSVTCFARTRELSDNIADDIISALASVNFFIAGKEPGYEEESEDYSTTIQVSYLKVN